MRSLRVAETDVHILDDAAAVTREAAERTAAALREAITDRDEAHLVLTGGSSAVALYRDLAAQPWQSALDWSRVHLWWGDDRFVPTDHPDSNAGLAYRLLMAWSARLGESGIGGQTDDVDAGDMPGLSINAENVHPIPMEPTIGRDGAAEAAAQAYGDSIMAHVRTNAAGVPVFDVIHLGVGPDGHVMSIFPQSPALDPDSPLVLAVPAPEHVEPHLARVTLAARVLTAARLVIVMTTGSEKAAVLADVLGGDPDTSRWPAQAAIGPNAVWLIDEEAAAKLPR
jgi:6-phosphogluconolactonase